MKGNNLYFEFYILKHNYFLFAFCGNSRIKKTRIIFSHQLAKEVAGFIPAILEVYTISSRM